MNGKWGKPDQGRNFLRSEDFRHGETFQQARLRALLRFRRVWKATFGNRDLGEVCQASLPRSGKLVGSYFDRDLPAICRFRSIEAARLD